MSDQERRRELAHFLRSRRERLSPAQAGLSSGSRRRTPGLRREELALLAGIGVTWYTRLEQGRDITVSAKVLESLSRALGLSSEERNYLFILAHGYVPADPLPFTESMSATLQYILDNMGICPAYVVNPCLDLLAWNRAASDVFSNACPLLSRECNVLRFIFTNPNARALFPDWEAVARKVLALFRANTGPYIGAYEFSLLVADLKERSPEFRIWWSCYDVQELQLGTQEVRHPVVGRLALQATVLQVVEHPDLRMIVSTPLPEGDTAYKLSVLAGRAPMRRDLLNV